jgi:predicted DNA-binding protein
MSHRRKTHPGAHCARVEVTLLPETAETLRVLAQGAEVPMTVLIRDLIEHALNDLQAAPTRRTA